MRPAHAALSSHRTRPCRPAHARRKLQIDGYVTPYYRAKNPSGYYRDIEMAGQAAGTWQEGVKAIMQEALDALAAQGHDFSPYDANGDGARVAGAGLRRGGGVVRLRCVRVLGSARARSSAGGTPLCCRTLPSSPGLM